jgi:4-hydroxy-2-oxoheptanedioate aldolase
MENKSLKSEWKSGAVTLGAWCSIPTSFTAEIAAVSGYDFVVIDVQHGLMGFETALTMLQAVDTTEAFPIVRPPANEPSVIGKFLDAGAMGVIIPMTNSAADVKAAVAACRYAPEGIRSFGPTRADLRVGPKYFTQANNDIAVIPMIETVEALQEIEEIVNVPGVDGLFIGPMDLSVTMGLPPGNNDHIPAFAQALERVVKCCRTKGIVAGIFSNAKFAPTRVQQGFQMVVVAVDSIVLNGVLRADLAQVREAIKK